MFILVVYQSHSTKHSLKKIYSHCTSNSFYIKFVAVLFPLYTYRYTPMARAKDRYLFHFFFAYILVSEKPNAIFFFVGVVFIFLVVISLKERYNTGLKDK